MKNQKINMHFSGISENLLYRCRGKGCLSGSLKYDINILIILGSVCKKVRKTLWKTKNYKAGMTVEAAFVLPLVIFAVLMLLSVMDMMRFHSAMEQELMKSAKELAVYVPVAERAFITEETEESKKSDLNLPKGILSAEYAKTKLLKSFKEEDYESAGVVGGSKGISELYSLTGNDRDIVDLVFTYRLKPACNFFQYKGYYMVNRCRMHAWTGYDPCKPAEEEGRYVYITENGTVYHLTKTCTYLDLSIMPVSSEEIGELRNVYGETYSACKSCVKDETDSSRQIFVTAMGSSYHSSLTCKGLRRTIRMVLYSDVEDMPACSRCGK